MPSEKLTLCALLLQPQIELQAASAMAEPTNDWAMPLHDGVLLYFCSFVWKVRAALWRSANVAAAELCCQPNVCTHFANADRNTNTGWKHSTIPGSRSQKQ